MRLCTYFSISGLIEDVDKFQEVSWKNKRKRGLKCIFSSILNVHKDVN